MIHRQEPEKQTVDANLLFRIDPVCERFEDAWSSGNRPEIEEFISDWRGADRSALLEHLLPIDIAFRKRLGEEPPLEEYRRRFPEWSGPGDALSSAAPVPDLKPGSVVGEYVIRGELGRGGMGVVYRAEHPALRREVALKVLPSAVAAAPVGIQRFQREARAVAQLHHTNIVPIFEVGEDGGRHFYAMQLIDGVSLDRARDDEGDAAWGWRRAAEVVCQAADAIGYAHARGVVHRDIKPSNLLLDERGVTWITDFGLARLEDQGMTRTGEVVGTLRYLAPERFQGLGDERSDVYALGATLYELVTGRPAFTGQDAAEVMDHIQHRDPPSPREHDITVPVDLTTIISKAMQKDPARRYASAPAMTADLEALLDGRPIAARQIGALARLSMWRRRNRGLAVALTALATTLVVATVASIVAAIEFRETSDSNIALREQAETASNELRTQLYRAKMQFGVEAWEDPTGLQRLSGIVNEWLPDVSVDLAPLSDPRGFEWHLFRSESMPQGAEIDIGGIKSWSVHRSDDVIAVSGEAPGLALLHAATHVGFAKVILGTEEHSMVCGSTLRFSPDGAYVAIGSLAGGYGAFEGVRFVDTQTWTGTFLRETMGEVWSVAWHPTEPMVAAHNGGGLQIWNTETEEAVFEHASRNREHNVAFSNDGRWLAGPAMEGEGRGIVLRDTQTWEVVGLFASADDDTSRSVGWRADDRKLAVGYSSGRVEVWDVEDRALKAQMTGHVGGVLSVQWSPRAGRALPGNQNGLDLLASSSADTTLRLWNTNDHVCDRVLRGHTGTVRDFFWSPDGTSLTSTDSDSRGMKWEVAHRPARRSVGKAAGLERVRVVWDPSGNELATLHGGRLVLWSSDGAKVNSGHAPAVHDVDWSPDGQSFALVDAAGITIRNSSANQVRRKIPLELGDGLARVSWHPSDPLLLVSSIGGPSAGLWIVDANGAEPPQQINSTEGVSSHGTWSADGQRIVFARDRTVVVYDRQARQQRSTEKEGGWLPIWCPRTGQFVFAYSGEVRFVDPVTFERRRTLSEHSRNIRALTFSPDGSRMVTLDEGARMKLWETDGYEVCATFLLRSGARKVAFSPDSQRLAIAFNDGVTEIWDASRSYALEAEGDGTR